MRESKRQIDLDILEFLENIEDQSHNDRIETLRNMFDKHLHLTTAPHQMDFYDLQGIISGAKKIFANDAFPVYLGEKQREVNQNDLSNMCVVESTISHLNKTGCLRKLAKFDKRESQFKEE